MRIGRRSVAALLCLLMCLSFVNWSPAKAAAEDDVAAPVETGETAPESAPQSEAEEKDAAAPAPEIPAPEEDDPSAPAEAPVEPEEEPADAPETQEPAEEPADEEPEEEPADGEDMVMPASLEEPAEMSLTASEILLDAGKGQFKSGEKKQTVTLEDQKLSADQEEPACEGWKFIGWYDQNPTELWVNGKFVETQTNGMKYEPGETKIEEAVKVLYAAYKPDPDYEPPKPEPAPRTVILDAGEGWFGDYTNLPNDQGAPDGYTNKTRTVVLEGNTLTKNLADPSQVVSSPDLLAALSGQVTNPTRSESGTEGAFTFEGWYTQAPTEYTTEEADGTVTWHVSPNGSRVNFDETVSEGVTRLYAYYSFKSAGTTIFYKLDFNGWKGGQQVMTLYRKENSKFGNNGVISGVNYAGTYDDELFGKTGGDFDAAIEGYWKGHAMDGYKFKGWYTDPKAGSLVKYDTVVEAGATYYAHWTGPNGTTNETFTREEPEEPKPATGIFFTGTDFTTLHTHPGTPATVSVQTVPVRATAEITWEVIAVAASEEDSIVDVLTGYQHKKDSITLSPLVTEGTGETTGVTVTVSGKTLTVTGPEDAIVTISASINVADEDGEGTHVVSTPVSARVVFSHEWVKGEEKIPTACMETGYAKYSCAHDGCHAEKTVEYAAEGHRFGAATEVKSATANKPGQKQRVCVECGEVEILDLPAGNNLRQGTSGKTVEEIAALFTVNHDSYTAVVTDHGKELKSGALVGTGAKITVKDAKGYNVYTTDVIVSGDTNGDGVIDQSDAQAMIGAVLDASLLTGAYSQAAQVTGSGSVSTADVVAVLDMIG